MEVEKDFYWEVERRYKLGLPELYRCYPLLIVPGPNGEPILDLLPEWTQEHAIVLARGGLTGNEPADRFKENSDGNEAADSAHDGSAEGALDQSSSSIEQAAVHADPQIEETAETNTEAAAQVDADAEADAPAVSRQPLFSLRRRAPTAAASSAASSPAAASSASSSIDSAPHL